MDRDKWDHSKPVDVFSYFFMVDVDYDFLWTTLQLLASYKSYKKWVSNIAIIWVGINTLFWSANGWLIASWSILNVMTIA